MIKACEICGAMFKAQGRSGIEQRKTCSRECRAELDRRRAKSTFVARFWNKVKKSDGCWEWMGATSRGYGVFGKNYLTHRLSYTLAYGEIPDGLLVCHHCDNRRCVRPDHLFIGTHHDNTQDMVRKGRARHGELAHPSGDEHWMRKTPERIRRGDRHHNIKLTDRQVAEIRTRYDAGGISQYRLAAEYGVSRATIGDYITGRRRGK